MVVLIGDPSDFAIECMVEPGLVAPSSVWGRMCVHVAGTTLGDFSDTHCGLGGGYWGFKWHSENRERLWEADFDGLAPERIYDIVHDALYGNQERTNAQIRRDAIRFSRYDFLTNWDEQFDGFSSVIVSPTEDTMMILHRPQGPIDSRRRLPVDFVEARCSRSGFVSAAVRFVSWFEHEQQRLQAVND